MLPLEIFPLLSHYSYPTFSRYS